MLALLLLLAVLCAPPLTDGFTHQHLLARRSRCIHNNSVLAAAAKEPSPAREQTVVILYHKPSNVITSHSSADEVSSSATSARRTVYDDVMSVVGFVSEMGASGSFAEVTGIQSKLHAIGRLDADTTGLLLLTNDGALVHRITNPTAKSQDGISSLDVAPVQKTYEALIMGHHSLPDPSTQQSATCNYTQYPLQQLLDKGVALSAKHGGQTKPVDALSILSHPTRTTTRVSIAISEGKNRQIRRMFHAVGSGVMRLHRVQVGRLTLGGLVPDCQHPEESELIDNGLKEGQWRLLTEEEIVGLGWKRRYLDDMQQTQASVKRRANGRRPNRGRRKKRIPPER